MFTGNELRSALSPLDSSKIILVVDSCNSGGIRDYFTDTSIIVLASCKRTEQSYYDTPTGDYNPSWTLETKINNMSSVFSRALGRGLYKGLNLFYVFSTIAEYDVNSPRKHINQDMHPVSLNLDSSTGNLVFYVRK